MGLVDGEAPLGWVGDGAAVWAGKGLVRLSSRKEHTVVMRGSGRLILGEWSGVVKGRLGE